ncbi:MAG: gephyrin-like molybdotransferase Glp [Halioglobus sp.]|nr:gephyrin-like molybdotransferase Glp [Halioglobus sp.]
MSAPIPLEEALARMLASARMTDLVDTVPLLEARGRILAEDVKAVIDVPGADNSAMDGYALRAAEADGPLRVAQRIPAGAVGKPLAPGTAARIFTGAPMPPGADAVAIQENCLEEEGVVRVKHVTAAGDNVRPRGQDVAVGETVIASGRRLRPQDLGLLASVGVAEVRVFRPLRVGVLATGDELVEPGTQQLPDAGQLFNSNRYTLAGLILDLGMEFVDCGIVQDDPVAIADALRNAAARADCVITSGGVSVGEEDHVRRQVEDLGQIHLWRLAIKPGKPLAFGRIGDVPFIGLPGNPTSVFVTFCLVARPFLMKMQGSREPSQPSLRARAAFRVDRPGRRRDYLRVTVASEADGLCAFRYPNQSSGVLSSVSRSNALAVIPEGTTISEGDEVQVMLLDMLAHG